jgi:hypothetical protein
VNLGEARSTAHPRLLDHLFPLRRFTLNELRELLGAVAVDADSGVEQPCMGVRSFLLHPRIDSKEKGGPPARGKT